MTEHTNNATATSSETARAPRARSVIARLGMGHMNDLRKLLAKHLIPQINYGSQWPRLIGELSLDSDQNERDLWRAHRERQGNNSRAQIKAFEQHPAVLEQARINEELKLRGGDERRSAVAEEFIDTTMIALNDFVGQVSRNSGNLDTSVDLTAMVHLIMVFARATPDLLPADFDERETLLENMAQDILAHFSK